MKWSCTHESPSLASACLCTGKQGSRTATDSRADASPQWNIERGYQLAAVVAALQAIDADVVALQEVDIGCDRSGNADTGACC